LNRFRMEILLACAIPLLLLSSGMMVVSAADDENVLRLGLQSDKFTQMNAFVLPWGNGAVFGLTHIPLATFKPDLSVAPCLAENWETSQDGKSITFHLVKNATWHDGKPVTAEDVAFSFEYWKKIDKSDARGNWFGSYLDQVNVIDGSTVELVFNEPVAAVTLASQIPITYMVPEHVWKNIETPKEYNGDDALVGCGPFIFEKFDSDAQIAYLKANPDYFAGKPSVDAIEWRYYRSLDTLLLALEKGDIDAKADYYQPVSGIYAADLVKADDVDLIIVPDVGVPLHLVFGFKQYPTNTTEFRQAVSYAIDYQALTEMIAAGYGEIPGKGYNSPALPGFDSELPTLEYNITKADDLLNQSGFVDQDGDGLREAPDGSRLQMPITPDSRPQYVRAAEVISKNLQDVGLDVYVESLSSDAFKKKLWTDRDYYMGIRYSTPYANLAGDTAAEYYVDLPGMFGTSTDPKILEIVTKAIQSKDMDELSQNRRAIQEYVAEEQPIIALVWGDAIYPVRTDRWEGWTPMYGYGPVNYWSWFSLTPVEN
jgi:peptide/nickel transport system substrate-binding protein